jgi:5-methylthioadenosine/S-adenosylhomocysteine deaminase
MINQIVYSMNPAAITDTVINGKYIKKDGKMNLDIENNYRESLRFLKAAFKV